MENVTKHIIFSVSEGIATIRLNDPVTKNAFTEILVKELYQILFAVGNDPDINVLVLCGLPQVFCSGASRELLLHLSSGAIQPTDILLSKAMLDVPIPVIAAMRGHAVGGGLMLGACADIVILGSESRYGFTFMDLGFTPGMGATTLLSHFWSPALIHELLFSGELRRGAALSGTGVNAVLPAAEVETHAFDLAARIADKPRLALQTLKRTLSITRRRAFEEAYTIEALMHAVTFPTAEVQRRIEEFNAQ